MTGFERRVLLASLGCFVVAAAGFGAAYLINHNPKEG